MEGLVNCLFFCRAFICVLIGISIAWVPVIETMQEGEMYIYIQSIAAYLSPPIAAIYCLALFTNYTNEKGAFWGLLSGFLIGITRMLVDFYFGEPLCYEEDSRPALVRLHYMYFALILFWVTIAVSSAVSWRTGGQKERWRLIRTTFRSRMSEEKRKDDMARDDGNQYMMCSTEQTLPNLDNDSQSWIHI